MQVSIDESNQARSELLTKLNKLIRSHFSSDQAEQVEKFIKYYYRLVSLDDLYKRKIEDLYGAALSHWNFLTKIDPDKPYVTVYNPEYDKHGWSCSHTVIEIVHPDMPFVVDSISRAVAKLNLTSHLMITPGGLKIVRDDKNNIINIQLPDYKLNPTSDYECLVYIEIDRQNEKQELRKIEGYLQEILLDVRLVVYDWKNMRAQATALIKELQQAANNYPKDEIQEVDDFITWLVNDHFTFIGCCDYLFVQDKDSSNQSLQFVKQSGYGLLSNSSRFTYDQCFAGIPSNAEFFTTYDNLIVITKSSMHSTVHRSSYLDYIAVKLFGLDGKVLGERRFIGLYTAIAYNSSVKEIPFLRKKVNNIFLKANLSLNTHAGKNLLYILETLPRDDFFQASDAEIHDIAMRIIHMQERKQIKLLMRKDVFNRFYSCLVFLPKEVYNSRRRRLIADILLKGLKGEELSFTTFFSESILARIHFIIRLPININVKSLDDNLSAAVLEEQIINSCRTWNDELHEILYDEIGEEKASILYHRYLGAFPAGYMELYSPRKAVSDIKQIERIIDGEDIAMSLYRPLEEQNGRVRLKLFNYNNSLPLSEILPVLENMGMLVQSEYSNSILLKSVNSNNNETDGICYINDFVMQHKSAEIIEVEKNADNFQDCFLQVWKGNAENDKFNQLIIDCGFTWREAAIFRAYSKYFRQINLTFSENYIQETVLNNHVIARKLLDLFNTRLCPVKHSNKNEEKLKIQIEESLDKISNLDEDRILRKFLNIILATIRTNFFQKDVNNQCKDYISLKFDPSKISDLVLPLPMYEIFVYSPRVEGVHLRGAKVARGGLRWSDRREDFRTEVLGLMKAQQVKNAVIVPAGAKGGFVCKKLPDNNRDAIMAEVIACYTVFIKGLLDITDNIVNDKIVTPENVVKHDSDDPYLVVAADKGTATFSDTANNIAKQYGFWLDDAFASGGSAGYDHKKIGITARGAWESVKRNFYELGMDPDTKDFTVVGIGDMSGDVFGNGMLLSNHIKLIAAFNHMHIFLDPDPDPAISFAERSRLFSLPRSSWADYDEKLISVGGGIYSRQVKSIILSPEIKVALEIDPEIKAMMPNDLIKAILKSPVDLLWNGGIGTYIKSCNETDLQVRDRSNDGVRVNGKDLRCKVVGEGGNLGCTQLGRVEAALNGTVLFTDFIDNSGGVDCSDHEVNIKILLNSAIKNGDMTIKQRNELLAIMTDEVAALVLKNNQDQTYAISLAAGRAKSTLDEHAKFIDELERAGYLNRELEFLPTNEQILERKVKNKCLTRPEIAILVAYSKIILKKELLLSDLPDNPDVLFALESAFPRVLKQGYSENMLQHRLKREIIATQLSNEIINSMGFTYVRRLFDETGASTSDVVKAHIIAKEVYENDFIVEQLSCYNGKVSAGLLMEILFNYTRLIRRSTRWLLRNHRGMLDIRKYVSHYKPLISELWEVFPNIISDNEVEIVRKEYNKYVAAGIDLELAHKLSYIKLLYSSMDLVWIVSKYNYKLSDVAALYYAIGDKLDLGWFREQINMHPVDDNWDALARAASRDDVDFYQREIAVGILSAAELPVELNQKIEQWGELLKHLLARWRSMLIELKSTKSKEFTIFSVAIRELLDLAQETKFVVANIIK